MRKSTRFPKIQVYQVSHVDVSQFLRRIELELSDIRVESDETKFAWKWNSVNPNLFGRVASSPFNKNAWTKNIWTPTVNKSTCSILLILQKKGKILTSCTSPKTRWDHLGSCFPNEMFRGTRSKLHRFATQTWNYCSTYWGFCSGSFSLVSLWLGSCAGAFTIHVGCRHDPKEDQASDTTPIHRCLATEILSRILNVRSVVSAANGKQSDDPTMGRAEKLL